MYEIGKTYKIKDKEGIFYTATITAIIKDLIIFNDKFGVENSLAISSIAKSKRMTMTEVEHEQQQQN